MHRSRLVLFAALLLALGSIESAQSLVVGVSIPPQAWIVDQISGGRATVDVLLGPGASPETFQPTDADVSRMLRADLFLTVGVPFERGPWLEAVRRTDEVLVIDVRPLPDRRESRTAEPHTEHRHHGEDDPHVWLSPAGGAELARSTHLALVRADPDGRRAYDQGLERLLERLEALDRSIRQDLRGLEGATVVVYHPSWGRFTEAYGLRQLAIERDGKDPSDAELTELLRTMRRESLDTIFVEPANRSRGPAAIAALTGARIVVLDPLAPDLDRNLRHVADTVRRTSNR